MQKLGVTDVAELDPSPEKMKEEEPDPLKNIMRKTDEKYHRPVSSSTEKKKEEGKKKGMDYAQYKEKGETFHNLLPPKKLGFTLTLDQVHLLSRHLRD